MVFQIGDLVDVLDEKDNLWSPAVVYGVHNKDNKYAIKYVGWPDEYNETVALASGRLSPGGTHVCRAKAWVRLHDKLCWWPSIVYIRKPAGEVGISNLRDEKKVFIKPCGENAYPIRPYAHGVWRNATSVSPFAHRYEVRYYAGVSEAKLTNMFQVAIDEIKQSDAMNLSFRFDGSYECSSSLPSRKPRIQDKAPGPEDEAPDDKGSSCTGNAIGGTEPTVPMDPAVRAIKSKSHMIQAIRHKFQDDPFGIKPTTPDVTFNLREYFSKKRQDPPVDVVLKKDNVIKRKRIELTRSPFIRKPSYVSQSTSSS